MLDIFFFYVGFLSRAFSNHRTAKKGGGYFINSSLTLPPASQTLRHYPGNYCRQLTTGHSQQLDSTQEPLVSKCKSLTTKLCALEYNRMIKKFYFSSLFQFLKIFQRVSIEYNQIHQSSPISKKGLSIPRARKIRIVNRCKNVRSPFNLGWYFTCYKRKKLILLSLQLDFKDVFFILYFSVMILERIMRLKKWKVIPAENFFCKNEFSGDDLYP